MEQNPGPRMPLAGRQSPPATHQHTEKSLLAARRPRGGRKCIYMDSDEVKACRELGFELDEDDEEQQEHMHMYHPPLERIITSRISRQYSGNNYSSGDNSPIDNWRISSPGDDPREVKARLKLWAQAVVLESTSQLHH